MPGTPKQRRLNGGKTLNSKDGLVDSKKCIDCVRVLSADMVEKAKSGHPGAPMGCAPMAYALWSYAMNFSAVNPNWMNRDRFVLSNGHACALQYCMLHLCGYKISIDDLKNFRQYGSNTPGHPENFLTPGVEVCTGPLGQGISNAVGMAIGQCHLASLFNKPNYDIIDNYTYVICGDGCLQEGVSSESGSLAGHLGLGKLIVLYDDNLITIDGSTELSFTEDVCKRYESYGWHTITLANDNLEDIIAAIDTSKAVTDKPSLIKIRTVIGLGSSKAGTAGCHGAPLGGDDLKNVKKHYGFDPEESFIVPEEVKTHYLSIQRLNEEKYSEWQKLFEAYKIDYPEDAAELSRRINGELPSDWDESIPKFTDEDPVKATRVYSEKCLNGLASICPEILGGSADLSPSNLTTLKCSGDFQKDTPQGRYIRFGVREHAMVSISNGLFTYGGFRPFCATFLMFFGYALGSLRLSALSQFGVIFIATHDTVMLGEDGPTHQPIEVLDSIRSIPGIIVLRPADARETAGVYKIAMKRTKAPTLIVCSRQNMPHVYGSSTEGVENGAYVVKKFGTDNVPKLVIVATGSEVYLSLSAAEKLYNEDNISVNVVSMPCQEIYDEKSLDYKKSIFPEGSAIMSVEAGSTNGWYKYAHCPFGINKFGKSAPGKVVYESYGFTVDNLVINAKKVVAAFPNGAPSLLHAPKLC